MILSPIEIINGFLSLFTVSVYVIVGIRIMLKYRNTKEKRFLLVGVSWIGICEPWWPSTVGVVLALIFRVYIGELLYLYLNFGFLDFFLILWLIALGDALMYEKWNILIYIHIIITIIFQILFFYFLFTNISVIGTQLSPVDCSFGPLAIIFHIYHLTLFILTSFLFAYNSLQIEDAEIHLRGRFLLLAFILFLVGAILELIITITLNRIIILISAVLFYFGYILPRKIKELFLKSDINE